MQSIPSEARQWELARHPTHDEKLDVSSTFKLKHIPISTVAPHPGRILVKTKYISNAPGLRVLIEPTPSDREFSPTIKPGEIVAVFSIVEVVQSSHPDFKSGALLHLRLGWVEYAWIDPFDAALMVTKVPPGCDPMDFFSFQIESLTAYFGLLKVGKAASTTKTLLVSAAAGATGTIVCQIAKNILKIQTVIGIAGSDAKCQFLMTECGCDIALNYKDTDFVNQLAKATAGYIDLFFDNVGGFVLDSALPRMGKNGKVVSCGSVSSYDDRGAVGISAKSWSVVTKLRLSLEGFIFIDYASEFETAQVEMRKWMEEGKLRIIKTVYQSKFEDVPHSLEMILEGQNTGSLVTEILES